MKALKKLALFVIVLLTSLLFIQEGECVFAGLKIVLDPGHDSTHSGASANGIKEEVVNYKIAKYCYEELQNYEGITEIYMTRNGYECPYPGTTSTQDNKKRVEFAKSVGADVFVSLHNNSATSTSAKGASVYYPNANYNSSIGKAGEKLANIVQSHLIALGLENRGTHIRNSEDNTRYADGSLADYYGVIKNSKLAGFAGIIIEHAFLTNTSDVTNYLSTDAQLKLLGIADATGIAEYYGLSKKIIWDGDVSGAKASATVSSDYKSVNVKVTGLEKAPGVWIAVWSSENGQDDIKWYAISKDSSGNWNYNIPLSDFNTLGEYNVHVFVKEESTLYACETTYNLKGATASELKVNDIDFNSGTFKVEVNGVKADTGISFVIFAIWAKSDGSDIKWINATKESDTVYTTNVNMRDFGYTDGYYHIYAYGCDGNGMSGVMKSIDYLCNYPNVDVSAAADSDDISYTITASELLFTSAISNVYVDVWSEENGEDDRTRYQMTKNGDTWIYSDYLLNHMTSGIIHIEIYEALNTGNQCKVASAMFSTSKRNSENLFDGMSLTDDWIIWNGNKTRVIVDVNSIEQPKTQLAEEITAQAVSTEILEEVSSEAIIVSDEAANVSDKAVMLNEAVKTNSLLPDDIKNNYTLKENIYSYKESLTLYSNVRKELAENSRFSFKTFYLQSVRLIKKSDGLNNNLSGKQEVQFKLPEKYLGKNVKVIEFSEENGTISLTNSYNTSVNSDGYASIVTALGLGSTGNYIIMADYSDKTAGDMDFNGSVDLSDVLVLLKGVLGINDFSPEQMSVGDVNSDGSIDLSDVLVLLKKALGIVNIV